MHYTTKLFGKVALNDYFDKKKLWAKRRAKIKRITHDTKQDKWINEYMEEFMLNPIVLDLENRKLEYKTKSNNPEQLYIIIKIPFTASKGLVDVTPPQYKRDELPVGNSGNKYISLHFQADIFDSNDVHRAKYDKEIKTLKNCVEAVNKEVDKFNGFLVEEIQPVIVSRFERLRRIEEVAGNYGG